MNWSLRSSADDAASLLRAEARARTSPGLRARRSGRRAGHAARLLVRTDIPGAVGLCLGRVVIQERGRLVEDGADRRLAGPDDRAAVRRRRPGVQPHVGGHGPGAKRVPRVAHDDGAAPAAIVDLLGGGPQAAQGVVAIGDRDDPVLGYAVLGEPANTGGGLGVLVAGAVAAGGDDVGGDALVVEVHRVAE